MKNGLFKTTMHDKTLLEQLQSDDETTQDSALQKLRLPTPAAELLQRVGALFQQRQKQVGERRRQSAELQFDSWTNGLPVGVRGAVMERQLLFEAGEYDLDVQIVPIDEDHLTLHGQLLTVDDVVTLEGIQIGLKSTDNITQDRIADSLGRFTFSTLPKGDYVLTAFLPTQDVQFSLNNLQ